MAITTSKDKAQSEPNVTPMIDVMLVLLIIFMIIIPSLTAGFAATPPQGQNLKSNPEEETDQLLGIDVKGQYYLNKKRIENDQLHDLLRAIYDVRAEDKIMYLKADKDLEYGKVIDAIDVAAKAGVRVTGFITDQRPGTKSTVAGDVIDMTKKRGTP